MSSIAERLKAIADGCDECAKDAEQAAEVGTAGAKGEARAWRATANMIRDVVRDLNGTSR